MRRLFIIRKDLGLSAGKLAAMRSRCAEAYWTNLLKDSFRHDADPDCGWAGDENNAVSVPRDVLDKYVAGIFTKTICEAKDLNRLTKAETKATELGLSEDVDFGYIRDRCLAELALENDDGTCAVGMRFRPLDDETVCAISRGFKPYGAFGRKRNRDVYRTLGEAAKAFAGGSEVPNDRTGDFNRWLFDAAPART